MDNIRTLIALFPGQGSQKAGMGLELCQSSEKAKRLFAIADEALGFSLSKICFEGPADKLMLTENAQPAILTTSIACFQMFKEISGGNEGAISFAAAAGHSLGEYSALVAAEALKFEDAVALVNKRGRYMQEAVPAGEGKMVAILRKEAAEIEAAISKVPSGVVQIANVNAPGQIVVAGDKSAVDAMIALMPGVKAIELPVSAPFHCPLMKPAEEKLAADLAKVEIAQAKFPVYSNYFAKPLTQPEEIREALKLQVCGRVRWTECMQNAIREVKPAAAVEFGTGSVLTGMLKRIDSSIPGLSVDSVEAAKKALL